MKITRGLFFSLNLVFLLMGSTVLLASELKIGQQAPDFSTQDEQGNPVALKDFRGKTVVLYFYPKDDTPGCTAEAQGFRR